MFFDDTVFQARLSVCHFPSNQDRRHQKMLLIKGCKKRVISAQPKESVLLKVAIWHLKPTFCLYMNVIPHNKVYTLNKGLFMTCRSSVFDDFFVSAWIFGRQETLIALQKSLSVACQEFTMRKKIKINRTVTSHLYGVTIILHIIRYTVILIFCSVN